MTSYEQAGKRASAILFVSFLIACVTQTTISKPISPKEAPYLDEKTDFGHAMALLVAACPTPAR